MSIERQFGEVMFICDECGEASESFPTFIELREACKDDWLTQKNDEDEWEHICPSCCS